MALAIQDWVVHELTATIANDAFNTIWTVSIHKHKPNDNWIKSKSKYLFVEKQFNYTDNVSINTERGNSN